MFCLSRVRNTGADGWPQEILTIAGSVGNVYTVIIGKLPTCDCPYRVRAGKECKHQIFALRKVLRAQDWWQKAYLTSELQEIFENAPPIVPVNAAEEETSNNRKAVEEGDTCPICFDDLEGETVYCKAACGNNIHKRTLTHLSHCTTLLTLARMLRSMEGQPRAIWRTCNMPILSLRLALRTRHCSLRLTQGPRKELRRLRQCTP